MEINDKFLLKKKTKKTYSSNKQEITVVISKHRP
jgi:hypothetical protein